MSLPQFSVSPAGSQSQLFEQVPGPVHSRAQIELLAAVTWPDPCEVTDCLVAELWARRYGVFA